MNDDPLAPVLTDFCAEVGLPNAARVISRRMVQVKGMDVVFWHVEDDDPDHLYLHFQFGAIAAGRTLRAWRLMLEANMVIYAKDDARMAVDPDSGGVVLLVKVRLGPDITGRWLADTLAHYGEHGLYWQGNIFDCPDELFNGIASGAYQWIRC